MKILVLCDPSKLNLDDCNSASEWNHEFYHIPAEVGPPNLCHLRNLLEKGNTLDTPNKNYLFKFITESKPDLVVIVCEGCTENFINGLDLPVGPKYITWSTDSYAHTVRVTNKQVTIHFTSIPDKTLKDTDTFLPLFAGKNKLIPRKYRDIKLGVICRQYPTNVIWRERLLSELMKKYYYYRGQNLQEIEYNTIIRNFDFGLNLAIYPDGLPNFRSFQLGLAGVMPVSDSINEKVLRELFGEHIILFKKILNVPNLINECNYDEVKLQNFYNENHTFKSRMKKILEYV